MINILFLGLLFITGICTLIYGIISFIETSYRGLFFEKKNVNWLNRQEKKNIKHLYSFYNSKILHVHLGSGEKIFIAVKDKYTDKVVEHIMTNALQDTDIEIIHITNYENFIFFLNTFVYLLTLFLIVVNVLSFLDSTKLNTKKGIKQTPRPKDDIKIKDVGGLFEAKSEVLELINIVVNPLPYLKRGVSIPRGVLLEGPPGTGKTMLAKAIANEHNINFFYVSGSDFSKPLVGMGSMYVKEIFDEARLNKPSILFIDEIDSIGASRDMNYRQNDEKDSILNSILTEMDGFNSDNDRFLIMGATNRANILDRALLRPGRFDRIVNFGLPTKKERKDIISKYMDKIPQQANKEAERYILEETPGFSGAQIKNVINEAGLISIRNQSNKLDITHFRESIDYVLYGKKYTDGDYMTKHELEVVAYHESGHALMGLILKESPQVCKLTIIPRSKGMLGFVKTDNKEDKRLYSKGELLAEILILMAGRAAEEVVFKENKITTGASSDIETLNRIAKKLITEFGMSPNIGLVFTTPEEGFQKQKIEQEISNLLTTCYALAKHIITKNKPLLDKLKTDVMKFKTLEKDYFQSLTLNQRYDDTSKLINDFVSSSNSAPQTAS